MAADEAAKKGPEQQEGNKTPEAQKPALTPEQGVHAAARMEWRDLMSKEGLDRMQKIKERKDQIDAEQKKLQEDAAGARSKESWVNNPVDSSWKDGMARDKISTKVEEKFTEYSRDFEDAGLGDATNMNILKQVAKDLIFEYFQKNGSDGDKTANYVKDTLIDKLQYVFKNLKEIFDSKKHGYGKPVEVLEAFSNFSKTDFIKNGYLQASQLKEFLTLEKSSYEKQVTSFAKSMGLTLEKKQLEGEETTVMGKKLEPKELIEQKKITFNKTRFTAPKDPGELDKVLLAEIPKALPPIDDAPTKQKFIDYLIAEVKKLNPKPDEIFELSPDGKWNKIDTAAENKSKDDAKTDAEKQAAETAASGATKPAESFNLSNTFKDLGNTIMEFIKWFLALFGMKFGTSGAEDFVKEWKDVTPEEREMVKQFHAESKKYFSKMDNVEKMLKDQDQARRMFTAKKSDTKADENWGKWIERHVSKLEQDDIIQNTKIGPKDVADMFITPNEQGEEPSKPLQPTPQPAAGPGAGPKTPEPPKKVTS